MSERKVNIDEDVLKVIQESVTAGVNEGIRIGMKEIENIKFERIKNKTDTRRHNTEMLLKNYNNFKKHFEDSIYSSEQLSEDEEIDFSKFDFDEPMKESYIKAIIESKTRTEIILKQIDTFLEYFNIKCLTSKREDVQRRGQVIKLLYTNEETLTFEEVAEELHISTKTVDRDKKAAIKELSVLFFGIDGLKIY